MLLTLIRNKFTPAETLGTLLIDGKPFCDTLEPPVVPNARHPKGAIPEGWYKVQVIRSPKFGRLLPLLYYVPGVEGIRIHAGNNRDHTTGCILVGELGTRSSSPASQGGEVFNFAKQSNALNLSANKGIPTLYSSRRTEATLVQELLKAQHQHEEIYIEITDTERYTIERMSQPASYEYHC